MNLNFKQEIMSDFFEKAHIEGLPFPAVIHKFTDIDHGNPHDHPFQFTSHILHGWYQEEIYYTNKSLIGQSEKYIRTAGTSRKIEANTIHRITDISEGGCYTLIIPQQKIQEPAFYKFEDGQVLRRQWNETEFQSYKI